MENLIKANANSENGGRVFFRISLIENRRSLRTIKFFLRENRRPNNTRKIPLAFPKAGKSHRRFESVSPNLREQFSLFVGEIRKTPKPPRIASG